MNSSAEELIVALETLAGFTNAGVGGGDAILDGTDSMNPFCKADYNPISSGTNPNGSVGVADWTDEVAGNISNGFKNVNSSLSSSWNSVSTFFKEIERVTWQELGDLAWAIYKFSKDTSQAEGVYSKTMENVSTTTDELLSQLNSLKANNN